MTHYHGTTGDDTITGTKRGDKFDMSQGGNDTVVGGGGSDLFYFGGALTADDRISATAAHGRVSSTVELNGDYSAGVVFGAETMINIATLRLDGGHSYNLTFNDTTVKAQGMTVDASTLGANDTLVIDNSADTDGRLTINSNAGHTTLIGGAGSDVFNLGTNLNASDHIDGGGGFNTLALSGTYGALTLGASNIMHVNTIQLAAGTYTFTADSSFNSGSGQLQFNLTGTVHLDFDGSASNTWFTAGLFTGSALGGGGNDHFFNITGNVDGGAGDDVLSNITGIVNGGDGNDNISGCTNTTITGGDGDDIITSSSGTISGGAGNDSYTYSDGTFDAGTGNDFFYSCTGTFDLRATGQIAFTAASAAGSTAVLDMGASLTAEDMIVGSSLGHETVILDGDYSAGIHFTSTFENVDTLLLMAGHSYSFTASDLTLSKGGTMTVDGSALGESGSLYFDGSAETNGGFTLIGGDDGNTLIGGGRQNTLVGGRGMDTLIGGAGGDWLTGGGGMDTLNGGSGGNDVFFYNAITDSTGRKYDTVVGFDVTRDAFDVTGKILGVDAHILGGLLENDHGGDVFNQELAAAVNGTNLLAGHAVLFTPDSGSLAGHVFLVIDQNGVAGYQAGADYVIEMSGGTNLDSLTTHNFH